MGVTRQKILDFILENSPVSVKKIIEETGVTRAMVHRHLLKLLQEGKVKKMGKAPKVFYFPIGGQNLELDFESDLKPIKKKGGKLFKDFCFINPEGRRFDGERAFDLWCESRKLNPEKMKVQYEKVLKKHQKFKRCDLIDATEKFKETFEKNFLRKVFYLDFYSIEIFGKTRLGQLVLHAKSSQNLDLIREVAEITDPLLEKLIQRKKIEAIGFIPHSVARKIPFLPKLKDFLDIQKEEIPLIKITSGIVIAQKSLSKLSDRIENAKKTIFIDPDWEEKKFRNVLLIDDAVGSGATLNETAKKIKKKKIARNVYGLAIVGSLKGFEVISEI